MPKANDRIGSYQLIRKLGEGGFGEVWLARDFSGSILREVAVKMPLRSTDWMAWYGMNSDMKTHPVGQKQANAFGLFDMHGSVWEWREDVWHENYNNNPPKNGSAWLSGGNSSYRLLRVGSWDYSYWHARSSARFGNGPDVFYAIGFRVVVSARTQ